jgi:uncharacterized protein (TIGR00251 family)
MVNVSAKGDGVVLQVLAKPRASKSAVRGERDGALEIAIAAPPVDGEANEELVRFLARAFGVPARAVTIERGEGARHKRVHIAHISEQGVRERIAVLLPSAR